MKYYPTLQEIEIARLIAYNKQKSAQMINFLMCIMAVIGIILVNWLWPVAPVKQPVLTPINDTVYTYYRGDNGYIRVHKSVDFSPLYDHSEILKPIQP